MYFGLILWWNAYHSFISNSRFFSLEETAKRYKFVHFQRSCVYRRSRYRMLYNNNDV